MKKTFLYLLSFLAISAWLGCEKHDYAKGTLSPFTTIEDIRALYKTNDVTLDESNLRGADKVIGIVISDPDSLNVPEGIVVIQKTQRKRTRGIMLSVANASDYKLGDSLVINIVGKKVSKINGGLQIIGLTSNDIEVAGTNFIKEAEFVSSFSLNAKPDEYESTLVKVKGGTTSPTPQPTDNFIGDKVFINGADSLILHTEANAHFANNKMPASATFGGIVFINETNTANPIQIWPRTINDVTDQVEPFDPNGPKLGPTPIIITGFANDVAGSDGNYEYIQFLATRNIDFEKSPVAIVVTNNASSNTPDPGMAPAGGWASGGKRTYKFNITSGTVAKGEFFYVGGDKKLINGPNTIDISSAKWMVAVNYSKISGDGFGEATSNLLANSGNGAGVAVFEGVNVLETSIPIDVVFYGGTDSETSKKFLYDPERDKGYRVAANDHYSPVDLVSGAEQPFIYKGTNTYRLDHYKPEITGKGTFYQFGGQLDATTKKWITPRGYFPFTMDLDPTNPTTLSDIEGGNVTTLVN